MQSLVRFAFTLIRRRCWARAACSASSRTTRRKNDRMMWNLDGLRRHRLLVRLADPLIAVSHRHQGHRPEAFGFDRAGETRRPRTPGRPGPRLAVRPNALRVVTILLEGPDAPRSRGVSPMGAIIVGALLHGRTHETRVCPYGLDMPSRCAGQGTNAWFLRPVFPWPRPLSPSGTFRMPELAANMAT